MRWSIMWSRYILVIYSALLVYSSSVESSPVSQSNSKDIVTVTINNKPLSSSISRSTTKKPKRSPKFKSVRESEAEGENDVEVITNEEVDGGNADTPSAEPPMTNGLPRFPSFNKPFEEFQADLDKIFEHINAGLEKVVESVHELVHDPGVSHDKLFITSFNPNLFKDMVRKYDEEQARKRRLLEEQKELEKAARIALRSKSATTTAKSSIVE